MSRVVCPGDIQKIALLRLHIQGVVLCIDVISIYKSPVRSLFLTCSCFNIFSPNCIPFSLALTKDFDKHTSESLPSSRISMRTTRGETVLPERLANKMYVQLSDKVRKSSTRLCLAGVLASEDAGSRQYSEWTRDTCQTM